MLVYAFPPVILLPHIQFLDSKLLVDPVRWEKAWMLDLQEMALDVSRALPPLLQLLKNPGSHFSPSTGEAEPLHLSLVQVALARKNFSGEAVNTIATIHWLSTSFAD